MICPHCSKGLRRKERGNKTCQHCRQKFAIEPKEDGLQLHDLRLKALARKLSEDTYAYTPTQLWYAAARKRMRADASVVIKFKEGAGFTLFLVFLGLVCTASGVTGGNPVLAFLGGMVILIALLLAYFTVADALKKRVRMPVSLADFHRKVLEPWLRVYRADPPHMVREKRVPAAPVPPQPVLAVLSPDASVFACLAANEVPTRFNIALASRIEDLPANAPTVAVLHDASVAGYFFAAQARAQLAPRPMLDIGPRPRSLTTAKGAVRLRESAPGAATLGQLSGALTGPELALLAKGWWWPVAALRPSALIARVTSAVERAGGVDPDRSAAAAVGFLTWPGAR